MLFIWYTKLYQDISVALCSYFTLKFDKDPLVLFSDQTNNNSNKTRSHVLHGVYSKEIMAVEKYCPGKIVQKFKHQKLFSVYAGYHKVAANFPEKEKGGYNFCEIPSKALGIFHMKI